MSKGKLYIIPIQISESPLNRVLPDFNTAVVKNLRFFVVERTKTARQFLRKMDRDFPIDDSKFYEQDKHDNYSFHPEVIAAFKEGQDVGLMSESGYPAIADPGNKVVAKAQEMGVEVVPLVGPSSLLMALAASGLNGQGFSFNGYLPVKDPDRSKQIKFYGDLVQKTGYSQIFIETPYRNNNIFEDFTKQLSSGLKLCIAYDVSGSGEKIYTKSIAEWKKQGFKFDKTPCVFILGR
ncbi:SAM-dependent methyltransferase [Paracrocinitomix mangrovi]|uniref:SAM-dependent methyltransferase n=1 Tax=Paracrocinitomix mangrovi TaxID=2862509 RepID=UPI001C8DEE1D|nr:SAM-dependent methyltransferase [Paracrocinitomix mangrovi]UKN01899.1 SAM-dependent methyltransferase [Paracrocinitomix mangrovi]